VKEILKDYHTFTRHGQFETVISKFFGHEHLIITNGAKWKTERTVINPIFGKLSPFYHPISMKSDQVIDSWSKSVDDGHTDGIYQLIVGKDIQKMTLDVLGLCVLGKDFNFFGGHEEGPLHSYQYIMECAISPLIALLPEKLVTYLRFTSIKKLNTAFQEFDEYMKSVIYGDRSEDSTSLAKLLIEANEDKILPYEAIRDNILIFFIAGHETTATTLHYIIYNMALYPEYQDKLREEIMNTFPNDIDDFEKLKEMNYMSNVINETLRLFPPAGLLGRKVEKDYVLGDWFIPKGTSLQIFSYSLQRDKLIWGEDAEDFNPDRFYNLTKEQKLSFMPFGQGPRICIGMMFSLIEQKIFLTKLFKRFKISLASGSKLVIENMLFAPKTELLKFNFEKI